jgi:hypothetical protein
VDEAERLSPHGLRAGLITEVAVAEEMTACGGDPAAVSEVCNAMTVFIKGAPDELPKAAVTVDRFNAVKIVNEAVDKVLRAE